VVQTKAGLSLTTRRKPCGCLPQSLSAPGATSDCYQRAKTRFPADVVTLSTKSPGNQKYLGLTSVGQSGAVWAVLGELPAAPAPAADASEPPASPLYRRHLHPTHTAEGLRLRA